MVFNAKCRYFTQLEIIEIYVLVSTTHPSGHTLGHLVYLPHRKTCISCPSHCHVQMSAAQQKKKKINFSKLQQIASQPGCEYASGFLFFFLPLTLPGIWPAPSCCHCSWTKVIASLSAKAAHRAVSCLSSNQIAHISTLKSHSAISRRAFQNGS